MSPSGSMKKGERSIPLTVSPTICVCSSTDVTVVTGARFAAVTRNGISRLAESCPGSVAVMVTVVVPSARATTVMNAPSTATVAMAVSALAAA